MVRMSKGIEQKRVALIIRILTNDIEPAFNNTPRCYFKYNIHKNPKSKYYKILSDTIAYLERLKSDHSNLLEDVIKDFLIAIYSHYKQFNRTPNLNQLAPSETNQILFDDWIVAYQFKRGDEYWEDATDFKEAKKNAKLIFNNHVNKEHQCIMDHRRQTPIEILEA